MYTVPLNVNELPLFTHFLNSSPYSLDESNSFVLSSFNDTILTFSLLANISYFLSSAVGNSSSISSISLYTLSLAFSRTTLGSTISSTTSSDLYPVLPNSAVSAFFSSLFLASNLGLFNASISLALFSRFVAFLLRSLATCPVASFAASLISLAVCFILTAISLTKSYFIAISTVAFSTDSCAAIKSCGLPLNPS